MNLEYAVERLYEVGWRPSYQDVHRLPDGREYPSVHAVRGDFARAELQLVIKHTPDFGCYRATWAPLGQPVDPPVSADARHGTVIGASEQEAAVYALAQLKTALAERQVAIA